MVIQELIERLSRYAPGAEVMVLDGFNGGGVPRAINIGPSFHTITQEEADNTADCEDLAGQEVVLIGFGCY